MTLYIRANGEWIKEPQPNLLTARITIRKLYDKGIRAYVVLEGKPCKET